MINDSGNNEIEKIISWANIIEKMSGVRNV